MIDDEVILDLFFERSERAIQELDRKYGKICRSISNNILNSLQDAEECVNDAYLGAWNRIPPARPLPLLPYIARIVRNISLKAYQKRSAAKCSSFYTVSLQELEECVADSGGVDELFDSQTLARTIEAFLDTLTRENRVIFIRRYWFCESYREIAGFVGLSEKNISVRLTRMRKQLKQYLQKEEVLI